MLEPHPWFPSFTHHYRASPVILQLHCVLLFWVRSIVNMSRSLCCKKHMPYAFNAPPLCRSPMRMSITGNDPLKKTVSAAYRPVCATRAPTPALSMKLGDNGWSSMIMDEARWSSVKLELHRWSWSTIDEAGVVLKKLELHRWSRRMMDEAGVRWVKIELHGWSLSIMGEAGVWSMKLEHHGWCSNLIDEAGGCGWSSSFMDEAGDGLYSVMSRSRFRRVYRQAIYSRQCAWSYGSGGVSKARGIYTCGCTKTHLRRMKRILFIHTPFLGIPSTDEQWLLILSTFGTNEWKNRFSLTISIRLLWVSSMR